jgi:hypothetical protein
MSLELAAQRAATISVQAQDKERSAAEIAGSMDNLYGCEMCSG